MKTLATTQINKVKYKKESGRADIRDPNPVGYINIIIANDWTRLSI